MKSAEDRLHILSLLLRCLVAWENIAKKQEIHASDHTVGHFKCVQFKKQQTSRQKDTNNPHGKQKKQKQEQKKRLVLIRTNK